MLFLFPFFVFLIFLCKKKKMKKSCSIYFNTIVVFHRFLYVPYLLFKGFYVFLYVLYKNAFFYRFFAPPGKWSKVVEGRHGKGGDATPRCRMLRKVAEGRRGKVGDATPPFVMFT